MFAQSFSIWRNFEENSSCRTDTNNIFLSQFKIWGVAFASQAKRTYHFWHIFYRIYEIEKSTILTNHLSSKTLNNLFRSTSTEYNPGQTKVPFPFGPMNNLFKKYYFSLDLRFYGIRKTEPSMFNQLSHKNISEVHLGRNKIGRLQSGTLEGLETVR